MVYSALMILGLALSAFGQQFISAPVITDNVVATYRATLFDSLSSGIRGSVTASAAADGDVLSFQVSFTGLPAGAGPFPYHVHVSTVPGDGNCNAAGSHLDPYNRGEVPPCDPSDPATCQIGDLSGKHGNATAPTFSAQYTDPYLSNNAGSNAFVGDRSIVIHAANGTRLNCGNFQFVSGGNAAFASTEAAGTTGLHVTSRSISTRVGSTTTHVGSTSTSTQRTSTSTSTHATPPSISTHIVPVFTSTHVPTTFTSTRAVTTSISTRPSNSTAHQ